MTRLIQDQASTVIRERDRRRLRAMVGVLLLGGVLTGGVLGYVWLQVQRVRVAYELEDLRVLKGELEEFNRKLRIELATLRASARIDRQARHLGLTLPEGDQVRMAREFAAPKGEEASVRTAWEDGLVTQKRGRP